VKKLFFDYKQIVLRVFLVSITILLALLFILSGIKSQITTTYNSTSESIYIVGEYSVDDGNTWEVIDGSDYSHIEKMLVRGHFSRNIDDFLIVQFDNVSAKLSINGEEIFTHGYDNYGIFNSSGMDIAIYDISDTTMDDYVEMEIYNYYYDSGYFDLLNNLCTGNGYELFTEIIKNQGFFIYASILIIGVGLLCLLLSIIAHVITVKNNIKIKNFSDDKNCLDIKILYAFSFFALACGYYSIADAIYPATSLFFSKQLFCNIFDTASIYFIILTGIGFVYTVIKNKSLKNYVFIAFVTVILAAILAFILQLFGVADLLQTLKYFYIIADTLIAIVIVCLLIDIFKYKNIDGRNIFLLFIPFMLACLLDAIIYYNHLISFRYFSKIGILISILLQFYWLIVLVKKYMENIVKSANLEAELAQSNINIMLSQMQPHFIYNTLGTIKSLCSIDPESAEKATDTFSCFIKDNMDALTSDVMIPFEKELKHIENYLSLEQLRFTDRLKVEWDIRAIDFNIPIASLKILVENAVEHGITKKIEGGTIIIKSEEKDNGYEISVSDDGVGFDTSIFYNDKNKNIGLFNVEKRINYIYGGIFKIHSTVGNGTKATIYIPKEAK
jgi:sensor histidine kinase YesM